jgi:hypothetical protein
MNIIVRPPSQISSYVDHDEWMAGNVQHLNLKEGAWILDSWDGGLYGRSIWELRRFTPRELIPREFKWEDPKQELRWGGKWKYVERYVDRLRDGEIPPPITVIQGDKGGLMVIDGHRRLAASDIVGKTLLAWVSWTVPSPDGTLTGLTYELARQQGLLSKDGKSFAVKTIPVTSPIEVMRSKNPSLPPDLVTFYNHYKDGRLPEHQLDSKIVSYVQNESSRREAMYHAASFIEALTETRGAPKGRLWSSEKIVRVYFGDSGYLEFPADGSVKETFRGKMTLNTSAFWPEQRRAYVRAMAKYLDGLEERLQEQAEARVLAVDKIRNDLEAERSGNPFGMEIFDFDFDTATPEEDKSPSAQLARVMSGLKRGDVFTVGRTKWVVVRPYGAQAWIYKHPSKHRKMYMVSRGERGESSEVVVFEMDGSANRGAEVVTGPLRLTDEHVNLDAGTVQSTKKRVLR